MHQIAPAAASLVHDEKALSKLDMVQPNAIACAKQVNQLLNFAALAPNSKCEKLDASMTEQQKLLNQVLFHQYLMLQQNGLQGSIMFNPYVNAPVAPFTTVQQEPKTEKPVSSNDSLKRKLSHRGVESQSKFAKTESESRVKSVNTALEAGAPPKKEYRMKGRVYIVQNERKKWDGRQWRRLCVAENCSCAARGATLYCVNHGKKKFNVNVKHYRRSNIPSGLEGLVKEPKEKKLSLKKVQAPQQVQPQLPQALFLHSAQSNANLMHILAQAALSTNM